MTSSRNVENHAATTHLSASSIWLVEDLPEQASVMKGRLSGQVDEQVFADSRSILDRLSLGATPDVLIVDQHLPGTLAVEVVSRVREARDPLSLPILVILERATKRTSAEVLAAGANECLDVPYDDAGLRARVDTLAQIRHQWAELDSECERLRLATDTTGVATWDFYPQTGLLHWDARTKELLGVPPDTVGDYATFLAAVHPDDREWVDQRVQRALEPGDTGEYRIQCRLIGIKNRVERWIATQGRAFFAGGRVARFIGTCLDITEQKQAEIELSRAREAAEAASRVKDEFLATISHELRTPLTPILTWTQMLASKPLPEDRRSKALEVIDRNARSLARLIEDLLDFSGMSVGMLRLRSAPVDMAAAVSAALAAIRPIADAKGVILVPMLEPDAGVVIGDAERIEQIASNLLRNAIQFTPRDGRVTITLRRLDAQVELAVADTGQGIAADFLPSIFAPFRQADSSVVHHHKGLGLELSITRYLTELHGGHIEAHSEGIGRGATFVARFPRCS